LRLNESQAAAAVGQIFLSSAYDQALALQGLKTAQILLTVGDTETRRRYLNAKATIATLLDWNIIPIINENDTVATTEIRYGDNDRLAARVASMMESDLLVLLSDIDGLYSAPPAENPDARLITEVQSITPEILAMAGEAASSHSRGGMKTKIEAARIATDAGTKMVIASGRHLHPLKRLDQNGPCSWFFANPAARSAKKTWIAGGLQPTGKVKIDNGALLALEAGKSLLPAGILSADGDFMRGDTVIIVGPNGHTIGRGLIEYDAIEARQIVGMKSFQISELLGPSIRIEMIHRNNLVLENTDSRV
jgi:glutamate 5-kinase